MRGQYGGLMPPLSWRHHLPDGADFDPVGDAVPAGLPAAWARTWSADPHAPLLKVSAEPGRGWVTAAELDDRSRRLADALATFAWGPGTRVLWSPDHSTEAIVSHLGALRAGLTLVPLNPTLTARGLAHVVHDAAPAAALVAADATTLTHGLAGAGVPLVLDHSLVTLWGPSDGSGVSGAGAGAGTRSRKPPAADAAALEVGGNAPALVCYTSGTTGVPKGAVLSHRSVLANSRALAAAWGWEPSDRLVHALPLFHGHGLCAALYTGLMVGASTLLLPGFTPGAVLDAVAAED